MFPSMTNLPHNNQHELPVDLIADQSAERQNPLIQRWYALTSLPEAPIGATFVQREAVRRSRLSSSVIFFFLILLLSLLPVTFLAIGIYPSYFWLTLGLFIICLGSLALLRRGFTNTAGVFVTAGAFAILTASLFTTLPFDETTLQGYDMYIILLLLTVCLLPIRWIFLYFVLSVGVIIWTLLALPLTPVLQADLHTRMVLILMRPIGILFMGGGIAYIFAMMLTSALRRANRAETIAKLEHEQVQLRQDMDRGIEQILQTHVDVSNGNLNARAPLSSDNVLWQIARSLNTLLIRFQRAVQAEHELQSVDKDVTDLVMHIQHTENEGNVHLPLTRNLHLDRLITVLQGKKVSMDRSRIASAFPSAPEEMMPPRWPGNE
jgi:hypothetical protein